MQLQQTVLRPRPPIPVEHQDARWPSFATGLPCRGGSFALGYAALGSAGVRYSDSLAG